MVKPCVAAVGMVMPRADCGAQDCRKIIYHHEIIEKSKQKFL